MKIIDDFKDKWYTQIATILTTDFLQKTVENFRKFDVSYPNKIKNKSYYTLAEVGRKRLGYKDKSHDPDFDSKCYFHYNVDMLDKPELADNIEYQNFIQNMDVIYSELDRVITRFIDECAEKNILTKSNFIREDGSHNSLLRILNYKPKKSCQTLAKAHTDRGMFTLTIYETHRGLQFLSNGIWTDINYIPWILNLFPCDFWSELSSNSRLWTPHQVVKRWDNLERSAIVIFISPLPHAI